MTDDGEGNEMSTGGHALRRNPFRSTAVADTALIGHDPNSAETNVGTAAHVHALALLRAYLTEPDGQRGNGITIMVSGDYGTGKTHLLVRMVDEALREIGEPGRALYVVAGEDGFLALYRNFLKTVTKDELVRQVSQYYADAVQAELQDNDVPHAHLADEGDTHRVEREYDVLSSVVNRRVHENLAKVTDNSDFTTALSLLMRDKRMADPVWDWLGGAEPAAALRNRRVERRIDDDLGALEALGVLALVLGGRDQKFVLAIDEMSDIFARSDTPRDQLMEAFRVLLETAKRSGACFILCGLPDLAEDLSPKVRERVSAQVELGGFTDNDIIEFILRSHERTFHRRQFRPFAERTQHTIGDVTRGNPRQVSRLLHRAFFLANDGHADAGPERPAGADGRPAWVDDLPEITDEILYQAARLLTPTTLDTVVDEIRRVAGRNRWPLSQEQTLPGMDTSAWAEFRVESGHPDGDCAVLVARSLLTEADIALLTDWVALMREQDRRGPVVVVAVGPPSSSAVAAVRELLRADPIVPRGTFEIDLTSALAAGKAAAAPDNAALSRFSRVLDSISAAVTSVAERPEPSSKAVAQEIAAHLAPLMAGRQGESRREPDPLPPSVADLFAVAEARVGKLLAFGPRVQAAFGRGGYDAAGVFRDQFFEPRTRQAIGAAVIVASFLEQFRARMARWFRESARSDSGERELAAICETYQAMEDWVPLTDLAPLSAVADLPTGIGENDPVEQAVSVLTGFAGRIRNVALDVTSERA